MKLFVVFSVSIYVLLQALLVEPFTTCPDMSKKKVECPPKAVWYQIVKQDKGADVASCYSINITCSGNKMTIVQAMTVMETPLNHTYIGTSNKNGTWDFILDGTGQPTSETAFVITSDFMTIYTCKQNNALLVQSGVYAKKKPAPDANVDKVLAELKKAGITKVTNVNKEKCNVSKSDGKDKSKETKGKDTKTKDTKDKNAKKN